MRENRAGRTIGLGLTAWSWVAVAATLWLLGGGIATAVTLTWDADTGTGGAQEGSGTWNTTNTNWWTGSGNTSWNNATPDWAVLGAGGAGSHTVILGEPITVGRLTFNAGPTYTLSGGTLNLGTYATTYVYVNGAGQDARIDSVIAGAKIYKYGAGRLILTGSNTFGTGSLDVNDGVLNIRHNNALGNSGYAHVVPAKTLEVQDGITVSTGLYLGNSSASDKTPGLHNISGDNTWAGYVRPHGGWHPYAVIGVDAGSTLTITGQIQAYGGSIGTLSKVGGGTLVFNRDNTYREPTYVDAGVLQIRNGAALGTTGAGTAVASGAALQMENNIAVGAEALTLNGTGISGTGTLRSTGGNNVWNGNVVENGARIGVDTGSTLTINGVISGSGTFRKTGGGKLILTGHNTYAATTDLLDGILNIRHDNALGTINYCHVVSTSAALELEGGITVSNNGVYIKGAGAGGAGSLRSVSGDNTWANYVRLHWDNPNATIGADAGSTLTVSGVIENSGGTIGRLNKVGDGTLILTHANTFGAGQAMDVIGGVLNLRNSNALGNSSYAHVYSGKTLQVQDGINVANGLYLGNATSGDTTVGLHSLSGDNAWNGYVQFHPSHPYARIGVDAGSTLTVNGQLRGNATFRKAGDGKLILTGDNSYAATTDVLAGVLNIQHDNALGTASYCHVYNEATLELEGGITVPRGLYIGNLSAASSTVSLRSVSGDNTWTGYVRLHASHPHANVAVDSGSTLTITGVIEPHSGSTGSLTKLGGGTLILPRANTYTGPTNVDEGVVNIRHANALGTAEAGTTVAGGAALQVQDNITVAAEALTLNGTGIGGAGALRSLSGDNAWGGPVTLASGSYVRVDADTLTLSGQISGALMHKYGNGTLILTGNNTFGSGSAMDVRGGVVNLRHNNALGNSAYCHVTGNNYALEVQDGITVSNGVYIKGGGAGGAGSLRSVSGNNTWAGYVRLHWDNPDASIGVDAGSTLTVTGQVQPVGGSNGSLHKVGDGTLILTNSNTYDWPTYVDAGTMLVNGSIASSSGVSVADAAILGGYGTVPGIDGAGLVSPGASPGILTAPSINPGGGLDFAFEFKEESPNYGNAAASDNDVMRLTETADPFSDPLAAGNEVHIYLNVADVNVGSEFRGGFYTDRSSDFLADLSGADFHLYVAGDGSGSHVFNGVNYYTLQEYALIPALSVTTVAETANFGAGDVNGYVMQLTAVPEPSTVLLLVLGGLGLAGSRGWSRRRARVPVSGARRRPRRRRAPTDRAPS